MMAQQLCPARPGLATGLISRSSRGHHVLPWQRLSAQRLRKVSLSATGNGDKKGEGSTSGPVGPGTGEAGSTGRAAHQHHTTRPSPLDMDIASIAVPMLVALAADPIAGLVDTAFVGRLGAVQLAGMAVALSIFGTVTKFLNMPLVSSTTTAVAAAVGVVSGSQGSVDDAAASDAVTTAASAAVLMALLVGALEAVLIVLGASAAVGLWGLGAGTSPAHVYAVDFLRIRALGAPFQVLMLTLQGVYRGLQDTRTPLVATLSSNILNVLLAPALIFGVGWGVKGAAAAIVISQALPTLYLLLKLSRKLPLQLAAPSTRASLATMFGPSSYLMLRTVSNTWTYAYATSVVAHAGAVHAAAHQVCFQLWMATTLTADSLAVAAQSLAARSLGAGDRAGARAAIERCVVLATTLGLAMAFAVGTFRHALARLFSTDPQVLALIASVMPVVVMTQPINALAFVWDGALFGCGGFKYASVAMAVCAVPAIAAIMFGARQNNPADGLVWVWVGLGLLMLGRTLSIALPYLLQRGPFARVSDESDAASGAIGAAQQEGGGGLTLSWGGQKLKLA